MLERIATKYAAAMIIAPNFNASDGWKDIPKRSIQRLPPPCSIPSCGTKTRAVAASARTKMYGANRRHRRESILLVTTRAMTPIPMPNMRWLNTTEVMFPNPRASSPNAAEEKTRAPQTTSTKTRSARGLSTCDARFFMVQIGSRAYSLYGNYRNDHSCESKDDRKHPITHDDFISRPADRLEMMMQGRDAQEFFSEESF